MKCQSCDCHGEGGYKLCQETAAHRVWCPTWLSAEEGPMSLCERHARNFMPEHNKNAANGVFYWGEEADKAWHAAYPGRPALMS
jgi:hypothetical protein